MSSDEIVSTMVCTSVGLHQFGTRSRHSSRHDVAAARKKLADLRGICELLGARPTLERVAALDARLAVVSHPTGSEML